MNGRKPDITLILNDMMTKGKKSEEAPMGEMSDGDMNISMRVDAIKALALAIQKGDWKKADAALCSWLDMKDNDEGDEEDMNSCSDKSKGY
jgi:hypothetical protein